MAAQLVDALQAGAAPRPEVRLNQARGVLLQGRFIAANAAARLTTAVHMQGNAVPVPVRFSSSTGMPDVAENDARTNPRGLAMRFFLPDGSKTDLVCHSIDGFPARSPEEFLRFLQAASRRTIAPDTFELYLQKNPAATIVTASIPSTPRSFATERFSMLHGFVLKRPQDRVSICRFHIQLETGPDHLTREQANDRTGDFLTNEIIEQVSRGRSRMDLAFQMARPQDRTDDISTSWTDNRCQVTLRTPFLDRTAPDQDQQARILFDLGRLTHGVAACGDPMLHVRSAAYHAAFRRCVVTDAGIADADATGLAPFPMQRASS